MLEQDQNTPVVDVQDVIETIGDGSKNELRTPLVIVRKIKTVPNELTGAISPITPVADTNLPAHNEPSENDSIRDGLDPNQAIK